jgi:Bacterial Ig domain/Lysyl oxidase
MLLRYILGLGCLLTTSTMGLAAIAVDATVSVDQAGPNTNVAAPAFSTTAGNELLLAFISTDWLSGPNTTVTSIAGGGLTWTLVVRANGQTGTSEVWRAFSPGTLSNISVTATLSQAVVSSMTIMSFEGVDPSGTNGSGAIGATTSNSSSSGPPTATLVTTRDNSWVFGVGNDFDNAIARTLGPNQTMLHQYLAPVGDTYWVQRQNAPTPTSGTTISINDIAPTTDRYNLAIVEVLPAATTSATYTISGSVTPAANGAGTSITLTQNGSVVASATADTSGSYTFHGIGNGTYNVTPSKGGFTFTPASQTVTVSGANQTVPAFTATATALTWTISGTVGPATAGVGTLLTLSGASAATATADAAGNYAFVGLPNGKYVVTPSKSGYTFAPTAVSVNISGANLTGVNFTATAVPAWSISGTVSPGSLGAGTLLTLSGTPSGSTTADTSGNYLFTGLPNGSYTITPSKTGYTFSPAVLQVNVSGRDITGVNFAAQATSLPPLNYPDLSVIVPAPQISIVGSGSTRMLQYTHDTFNGGSGPLVIQPVYNPASGNYQGTQYIYSFSAGKWTLANQIPVAGAFVFDAAHGHFHFPFSTYGLYALNSDGSIGSPVALSTKIGFCINDSFIYDPSLPNAGALGNLGPCTDPTSLRGLNIGAVDEYDQTDEGESISIAGVPDGTYWLRVVVDPNNYLAESDKSNNETDVKLAIQGSSVQVLQAVTPVLPPPPAITLTSPAGGTTLAGTITLIATTAVTTGVQFLVDGSPVGAPVTAMPYTLAWNTALVPNGTHWLAVQTTTSDGRTGTSPVVVVTVANSTVIPPIVQVTDPESGATVSASVPLVATAAGSAGIAGVQFYIDGVALGAPLTAPPYIVYWNTLTASGGQHMITASATDSAGRIGTSAPVTVTVDNSHPPSTIGKDVTVSADGTNILQTPAFSTTVPGELLVAFVAYDGPAGSPQTATVSGAGLVWTLLKRSNFQSGTAEIWAAKSIDPLTNVTVMSQPGAGTNYNGSLTVIAFTNASGPGVVGQSSATSGAPDIYLPGISAGDWVFAVGNDWDNAITRIPVSGQVLVHQSVDFAVGDTYWVQSTAAPSTADSLVDIHDTSPTADRWNYAAVEIVATRQ